MRRNGPSLGGSVTYLLLNLPLGIVAFWLLVACLSAGLGTAVLGVGLGLLALAVPGVRGAATFERARLYAQLDTYVDLPYLPLPQGWKARWTTRLRDPSTYRDLAYLSLLFPIGLVEFVLVTAFWWAGLWLATLPITFRFLPGEAYYFPDQDLPWITVDSTLDALPWAGLGLLLIPVSVVVTKALARLHAGFAVALLGPTAAQRLERRSGETDVAVG